MQCPVLLTQLVSLCYHRSLGLLNHDQPIATSQTALLRYLKLSTGQPALQPIPKVSLKFHASLGKPLCPHTKPTNSDLTRLSPLIAQASP